MKITESEQGGYVTLGPVGELDANSSIFLDEKIEEVMRRGLFKIHIDCSKLSYISSAGLGVFISFLEALKSGGGKFVFSGMSESVFRVFELLGLPQIMTIIENPADVSKEFDENGAF